MPSGLGVTVIQTYFLFTTNFALLTSELSADNVNTGFPLVAEAQWSADNASREFELGEQLMSIWTILFVILLIAWITGFSVFHVAGGLIHLLLVFAVISLILHFVMGRSAA